MLQRVVEEVENRNLPASFTTPWVQQVSLNITFCSPVILESLTKRLFVWIPAFAGMTNPPVSAQAGIQDFSSTAQSPFC